MSNRVARRRNVFTKQKDCEAQKLIVKRRVKGPLGGEAPDKDILKI